MGQDLGLNMEETLSLNNLGKKTMEEHYSQLWYVAGSVS
jgi:hypothetical protein